MGDVKKKTTKKTTKTSSVKKNINKEVVLSNDELLEQILNKKKTKFNKLPIPNLVVRRTVKKI